ncbi:hypothetical protein CRX72_24115 [Pantoea sp. BRM17]|nr:hypothetical protein CRX72_24115 [Pantoea sp. BRM17]
MSKKAPLRVLFCGADLTFITGQIDFSDAALVFKLPIISVPERICSWSIGLLPSPTMKRSARRVS